jgi:hypothetical protein
MGEGRQVKPGLIPSRLRYGAGLFVSDGRSGHTQQSKDVWLTNA